MGSDTNADRRRHAHRPPAVVNRMVLAVLRSPLHGLLDPGICELRYRGRRTGRMVALPVIYARYGERFVVVVGDASDKRWWRNFTDPRQVEVRRGRQRGVGTCRVVTPDDPDYEPAWCAYAQRQHVTLEPGDRLLVIDLPVSPAAGVRRGR
jgi:hypothetical protein